MAGGKFIRYHPYIRFQFYWQIQEKWKGGGLCFLINENLDFQIFSLNVGRMEFDTFESLFIRLDFKKCSPMIGVIYRPPCQDLKG